MLGEIDDAAAALAEESEEVVAADGARLRGI